jgi:hypothetical protein
MNVFHAHQVPLMQSAIPATSMSSGGSNYVYQRVLAGVGIGAPHQHVDAGHQYSSAI